MEAYLVHVDGPITGRAYIQRGGEGLVDCRSTNIEITIDSREKRNRHF